MAAPLNRLILLLLTGLLASTGVYGASLQEGRDYERIVPTQPTDTGARIEVVELFWYGCPHCHRFQRHVERWLADKPEDVAYRRMPAVFPSKQTWELHGRAFYTARALGVEEAIHQPLFKAIHTDKRRLDSEDRLAEFFAAQGVSEERFRKAFHSFTVEAKLRRAREMSKRYQIAATPSVVVNGKYRVDGSHADGNFDRLIDIINQLVQKERQTQS